jgi:hydrogenase maturation protease
MSGENPLPESASADLKATATGATVVLGIGNLILGDDGIGVHVARALMARGRPQGVEVLDGGTAPLDALATVGPVRRLIVVDAAELGEEPGTIRVLSPDDLIPASEESVSLHDLDLVWALTVLRLTQQEPDEVVVIGVQPASMDCSTELSPAVAARLEDAIEAVLAAIPSHTAGCEKVRE